MTNLSIKALCGHLSENPSHYIEEMVVFLWDEFQAMVTTSSIRKALSQIVGLRGLHGNVLENEIQIRETVVFIISQRLCIVPSNLLLLMNLDVQSTTSPF